MLKSYCIRIFTGIFTFFNSLNRPVYNSIQYLLIYKMLDCDNRSLTILSMSYPQCPAHVRFSTAFLPNVLYLYHPENKPILPTIFIRLSLRFIFQQKMPLTGKSSKKHLGREKDKSSQKRLGILAQTPRRFRETIYIAIE